MSVCLTTFAIKNFDSKDLHSPISSPVPRRQLYYMFPLSYVTAMSAVILLLMGILALYIQVVYSVPKLITSEHKITASINLQPRVVHTDTETLV
jgi:hypothetical protein